MVSDLIRDECEKEVGTETSRFAFHRFQVLSVDGDSICGGLGFVLPVQKLEKRRVVSMSEFGIIYFWAIHDGRLSMEKKLDSLSKL